MATDSPDFLTPPPRAFPHTHPDVLATAATVFGLEPPPVEIAKVLEIGCGGGGNLIPMAESLPMGRFLGIDREGRQIDAGRALIRAAGLSNVQLRHQDVADFADPGPFDYVIAHGVYSTATRAERERLLGLIAARLSPRGVAYVGYNVYPGWHLQAMLRDMFAWHTRGIDDPAGRVRKAKEVLDFLSAAAPLEGGPTGTALANTFHGGYGAVLKGLADQVRSLPDADLYRDYLGETNDPVYFHEFADHAAAHGLQYLGEAVPEMMGTAALPPAVDEALRRVAGDWADAEQYLDLVRNRAFRQTLLVHAEAVVRREGDPGRVKKLFAGSPAEPVPEADTPPPPADARHPAGDVQTFKHPRGSTVAVADPLVRAAMKGLADAWPRRLSFDQLVAAAWQQMGLGPTADGGRDAAAEKKLCALLLQGYFTGMVELSVRPGNWAGDLTARPRVRRLARLQAEAGDTVTTLRHQNLRLNRTARQLVYLLDGTRTHADLLRAVEDAILEGAKAIGIGDPVELSEADRAQLAKRLEQDLRRLVGEALFAG